MFIFALSTLIIGENVRQSRRRNQAIFFIFLIKQAVVSIFISFAQYLSEEVLVFCKREDLHVHLLAKEHILDPSIFLNSTFYLKSTVFLGSFTISSCSTVSLGDKSSEKLKFLLFAE